MTSRTHNRIRRMLRDEHFFAEKLTTERDHATELAQEAAKEGADVVCVLGGDGTLNEAANGLVGTDTALAALPGGSTNVFARSLGLPLNPVEAAERTLAGLRQGEIEKVGVGVVNERRFLFHAGVGFDAKVVELVEKRSDLKRWLRHPLFIWEAGAAWLWHFDKKTNFTAIFGAQPAPSWQTRLGSTRKNHKASFATAQFAVCLNTSPYTYLGNRALDIAPDANLDGDLVLVSVRKLGGVKLIRLAMKALKGGKSVAKTAGVDYHTDLKSFTIASPEPVPYQVDGDFIDYSTSLRFHHQPEALNLLRPRAASQAS